MNFMNFKALRIKFKKLERHNYAAERDPIWTSGLFSRLFHEQYLQNGYI